MPNGSEVLYPIDFGDLYELVDTLDVMRADAQTHLEFLNTPVQSQALLEAAGNFDSSQKRAWISDPDFVEEHDIDLAFGDAANDPELEPDMVTHDTLEAN